MPKPTPTSPSPADGDQRESTGPEGSTPAPGTPPPEAPSAQPRNPDARFDMPAARGNSPIPTIVRAEGGLISRFANRPKRSISVVTDKGGVGKSTLFTQLVQWFLDAHPDVRIRAYDPDNANRTLLAFQPNVTEFVDVYQKGSLDAPILDLMTKYDVILFDGIGSQQTKTFITWTDEISFFKIAEDSGIAPTFILIVEGNADVVEQAYRVILRVGDKVDWLIVRTHKSSEHMALWDNSLARQKVTQELGGVEIFFPNITEHLIRAIQEMRLPLSVASKPEHNLNLFDRQRLINLTAYIYGQFDSVDRLLLPPSFQQPR